MIHPTAIIAAGAQIGTDVEIGPYAVIGAGAIVGEGSVIQPTRFRFPILTVPSKPRAVE